jgi:GT2 family glycosyltransferase
MQTGLTIVIVVLNERETIRRALSSVDAPSMPWELLVVDNGSTDGTRAEVTAFRENNPALQVRWLEHAPTNLGSARALAVEMAKYPIVGFLDADCVAPPAWAEKSYRALKQKEMDPLVLGLGSGNLPPADRDPFNQALALQLSSALGHLNTGQARTFREPREVNHLPTCNVFYFRDRLLKVGNFSPSFARVCEDLELSRRASAAGYKLIYQPGLEVAHIQKPGFWRWSKKMFRYGWGQIEVARAHPGHLSGLKALPLLAGIIGAAWLALHPVSFVFFFLFYLGLTGICATCIAFARRKPHLSAHIFLLFVTTHFFYSAGELWGLVRQVKRGKMNRREGKQARL